MGPFAHAVFWLLAFLSIYSYFVYPLILRVLPGRRRVEPHGNAEEWPPITIIIAAHNESARIEAKLDNALALPPYPGGVEIIVASDASTDGTDEAVDRYAAHGVRLVRNARHEGKEAAQAMAIRAAHGTILVFSDVATTMKGDALSAIARHFRDPSVGAISSTDRFVDREGNVAGEGAYVKYEMRLRREESRVYSLVGLSGSFFAARAAVCRRDWLADVPSDFMTAVNCVRQGYVATAADDVVGYYADLTDPKKEYRRKVRTVLRGMRAVARTPDILNPRRFPTFSFQVWSHKIMRWATPWFLVSLLPLNALLSPQHPVYRVTLAAQLAFYALASIGSLSEWGRRLLLVRIPHYFVVSNIAVLHAGFDFLRGKTIVTWVPSQR